MGLVRLEKRLNIFCEPTYVAAYDFDFELFFECSHPVFLSDTQSCVLRSGAIADYPAVYTHFLEQNLRLINDPAQHERASELAVWYPSIAELTPTSLCCDEFPTAEKVAEDFGWPIFIKGSRQTSKHNPALCIARNADDYLTITRHYHDDPILHWQKIAIRRFVELMPVGGQVVGKVPASMEFRTFWWHNECVGYGQYWYQLPAYQASDIDDGLALAGLAAQRLNVPFLVIDIAKTIEGQWIVIECNDAQESGYTGVSPNALWRKILGKLS